MLCKFSRTWKQMNYKGEREGGTWLPAGSVAQVMVGWGPHSNTGYREGAGFRSKKHSCWEN